MPERRASGGPIVGFRESPRGRSGRRLEEYATTVWDIVGSRSASPASGDPAGGPEAFLVRADPGFSESPHFHDVDQYQLFWGGPGAMLGRQPLPSLLLQYVDGHTVYGPIIAGDHPLEFMTLRPEVSGLRGRLPADRDRLERSERRRRLVDLSRFVTVDDTSPTSTGADLRVERIWTAETDGVDVSVVAIAPQSSWELADEHRSATYAYVLNGDVIAAERPYSVGAVAWWSSEAEMPTPVAGARGATILVMSFPTAEPQVSDVVVGNGTTDSSRE